MHGFGGPATCRPRDAAIQLSETLMPSDATTPTASWAAPATERQRWVHTRDLLRELVARDMRMRYRGSWLGAAWTLLNPLTELAVLLFIFDLVLPLNIPNYGAFLFTGLLVYTWFQSSLNFATVVIVGHRELVRRPGFPTTILPVVSVAASLVHFCLSLPVLLALILLSGIQLTAAVLALPALIVVQFAFTLGLAYPLAAAHVWFRDTQYLLRVALQLLFYLSPIFYQLSAVPPRFALLFTLNPMVTIVEGYRDVLLRGSLPPLLPWLTVAGVSGVLLAAGLSVFTDTSHKFADEL